MKQVKLVVAMLLFLWVGMAQAAKPVFQYVEIKTNKGTCLIKLYNETPLHRDNFVKLAKEGYFDSLLFHRVINKFMIQGGDPDSRHAKPGVLLGDGGPDYTIPAEIKDGLFHKKGTIGAARDDRPDKASSGSQFYLVQGKKFSNAGLDSLESLRMKGKKFSPEQRAAYTTIGGTPHLDWNYTVFGEIIKGLEMVDAIAKVETDGNDRPLVDEPMTVRVLSSKEAAKLEKLIKKGKPF